MFYKINKKNCWVAFIFLFICALSMKFSYSNKIKEERINHAGGKDFLPVTATMQTYSEHVKVQRSRRGRRRREYYDITYQYEVGGKIYTKLVTDNSSIIETIDIYYNPDNPSISSFYINYQDVLERLKFAKIISDVFLGLSVIAAIIAIYRSFIYKAPNELGGTVIFDDFYD